MQREIVKIDATGQAPGRMATRIAMILMGKNKPTYIPNIDAGDGVEVINAANMKIIGRHKLTNKKFYKHTGYIGNMKVKTLGTMMREKPSEVLRSAVSGCLPKNRMRRDRLKRLFIS